MSTRTAAGQVIQVDVDVGAASKMPYRPAPATPAGGRSSCIVTSTASSAARPPDNSPGRAGSNARPRQTTDRQKDDGRVEGIPPDQFARVLIRTPTRRPS